MKNLQKTLFYNQHGLLAVKKKYRYVEAWLTNTAIDCSKLPEDLDLETNNRWGVTVGKNSHSTKFPAYSLWVQFPKDNNYHYYCLYNIDQAPLPIMQKCVEALRSYERTYYRALDELGDAGKLVKELL